MNTKEIARILGKKGGKASQKANPLTSEKAKAMRALREAPKKEGDDLSPVAIAPTKR